MQANKLIGRELFMEGRLIDPSRIACPVLALAHTEDLLAPPESAKAPVAAWQVGIGSFSRSQEATAATLISSSAGRAQR